MGSKAFYSLIAAAFLSAMASEAASLNDQNVRWVLKPGTVNQGVNQAPALLGAREFTFGLSKAKRLRISRLSGGQVNLNGIYYLDLPVGYLPGTEIAVDSAIRADVPPPFLSATDGDPDLTNEWWVNKLRMKEAWALASGAGVTLADCDAGYYTGESELAENLKWDLAKDLSDTGSTIVNDGGFVSHGTAVVSIIAAALNNFSTNGLAFHTKVVPLQNFNYDHRLDKIDKEEATAKCILHAITVPDVKIIVLENQTAEGSSETFAGTRAAVRAAMNAGVTIVSAAGNYSTELRIEADDDTGSVIVGALDPNSGVAYFSNFGSRITVAAFGEDLKTLTGPNGALGEFGGTSGATPQVASVVALMLEVNPHLSPKDIHDILVRTRVESAATTKVGGVLDAYAAVSAAQTWPVSLETEVQAQRFRTELTNILLQ